MPRHRRGGVLHAHAVAPVAFSITGQVPETHLFHQPRHVCGPVGFAPYALPGSEALGAQPRRDLRARVRSRSTQEPRCFLGASVLEAFDRLEVLQSIADALINSRLIGEAARMSDEVIEDLKRSFASMLA